MGLKPERTLVGKGLQHHGSHFLRLTNFPGFFSIFSIFQYFFSLFYLTNLTNAKENIYLTNTVQLRNQGKNKNSLSFPVSWIKFPDFLVCSEFPDFPDWKIHSHFPGFPVDVGTMSMGFNRQLRNHSTLAPYCASYS